MFHLAFICILIGSAITRYFGYEGTLHIREGETSNVISVEKTAVNVELENAGQKVNKNYEVNFAAGKANNFSQDIEINNQKIHIENVLFVPNAIETLNESANGEPAVGVFLMSGAEESIDFTLFGNETKTANEVKFGFANYNQKPDIEFSISDNQLYIKTKQPFTKTGTLESGMIDRDHQITVEAGTLCQADDKTVYRCGKVVFMIRGYYASATKMLTPAASISNEMSAVGQDALLIQVSNGNETRRLNVFSNRENLPEPSECEMNGTTIKISYGKMLKQLPFSITLRDFQLERYPGSMSPSSYASEITVTDTENKTVLPYRIYMNNILNYRGFRFFQSSYDNDETGTILSVNHDYWGTFVSYLGYFFMFLGMILTLFNTNSRFRTVLKLLSELNKKKKTSVTILVVGISLFTGSIWAQQTKANHIEQLNQILVQDKAQGRIEPLGSYAADVIRKITKHNSYKGHKAAEVVIGMSVDPSVWKNEPMIKIGHDELAKEIGAVNGYASYNNFFDAGQNYKLATQVDQAYKKEESQRNKYDKEVINVDERINICTQIFMHEFLAFFPEKSNVNLAWNVSSEGNNESSGSVCPYHGTMDEMSGQTDKMSEEALNLPPATVQGHCTRDDIKNCPAFTKADENLIEKYLSAFAKAEKDGNWTTANTALNNIKQFQKQYGGGNLPSEKRIDMELLYNKLNVFINLMIGYATIGIILLTLYFLYIFRPAKWLDKTLQLAVYPLIFLFGLYTLALAFRWYISGHAPWSNGYESMIFVGWAASLSGIIFSRKSPLAFSVTALLSAIALSVAAMSWMNPEITNLVPVLKSYWLIVHVAVITSSYGFLAMAAILGFMNLIFIIIRNSKNQIRVNDIIKEVGYIIELSLIVGLFMLTVGTFLGGIWANESWGRYWGWDAKETWALVSVLVYAIIIHLRLIPKMNNAFVLSSAALVGFSSVIMTFVGVNYYLSGMHSYGQGNPPPVPAWVYVFVLIIGFVIYGGYKKFYSKKQL
jgi:cytochrome c-type biogenesis protein CcsB